MKNLVKKISFAITGLALFALPIMVMGQSVGTTITPLIREANANPGSTFTGKVEVTNTGDSTRTYTPIVRDFQASDDPNSGAPQFVETSDEQSVSQWVSFTDKTLTIGAGKKASINYTVKVPSNATPGGHYGAVIASVQGDPAQGTGVTVQPEVGSLLLVTVSGQQVVDGKVIDFKPYNKVFSFDPVSFSAVVRNSGNVHIKPVGSIDITGPANVTVNVNSSKSSVLPNSTRNFTASYENGLPFGKYTAKLDLRAESPDGRSIPLTAITSFWVIPMSYILGLLAILIVAYVLMKNSMDSKKFKK